METPQVIIIFLLALSLGLLIYTFVMRAQYNRSQKQLQEETEKKLTRRTDNFLRMAAAPLSWAIRAELLRDNLHQIEDYMVTYVKQPGVEHVALAVSDEVVRIATNKKWEGQPLSAVIRTKANILSLEAPFIEDGPHANEKLLLVPVTGVNDRIATLAVIIRPDEMNA